MMERRFDLAPDYRTFAMLLPKLCLMHSLELFHYAYNDMKMHSYVPTKRLLETILLSLCDSKKKISGNLWTILPLRGVDIYKRMKQDLLFKFDENYLNQSSVEPVSLCGHL